MSGDRWPMILPDPQDAEDAVCADCGCPFIYDESLCRTCYDARVEVTRRAADKLVAESRDSMLAAGRACYDAGLFGLAADIARMTKQ